MNKVPSQVLEFAGGDKFMGVYKMFQDYWNHYKALNGAKVDFQKTTIVDGKPVEISFSEKEARLNAELLNEIMRKAGVSRTDGFSLEQFAGHPSLRWATFAVASATSVS